MAAARTVLVLALLLVAAAPGAAGAKTVWLCKPGIAANPCAMARDTARYAPDGRALGAAPALRTRKRVDCFYVYPTVSDQRTPAATKRIDPELRSIAQYQAARYGSSCRIFAPVYRQVTLAGLASATAQDRERAYGDVRAAWRSYLRHDNRGRGVVLIGHSQGTFVLRRLIAEEIEPQRAQRRKLVSALLLGGNVTVAAHSDKGGDFRRIRACTAPGQLRCVVAFSVFGGPVPPDAPFGRTSELGREVLCTNPAALAGGSGPLDPVIPRAPIAPGTGIAGLFAALGFPVPAGDSTWLRFPRAYTARCVRADGAHVLQVTGGPALNAVPPSWGLHLTDANIALGNLELLVRRQAAAYVRSRR